MMLFAGCEGVADLPAELQRSFKLLQELDQKAQALQQHVDTEVEQHLAGSDPAAGYAAPSAFHANTCVGASCLLLELHQ